MNEIICYLENNPWHGIYTTVLSFIFSILPDWVSVNKTELLWMVQVLVALIGVVAGTLTIIAKARELKRNKKKKCK